MRGNLNTQRYQARKVCAEERLCGGQVKRQLSASQGKRPLETNPADILVMTLTSRTLRNEFLLLKPLAWGIFLWQPGQTDRGTLSQIYQTSCGHKLWVLLPWPEACMRVLPGSKP
jgi:hypothetical protein